MEERKPELNTTENKYLKKVQDEIQFCSYDQSYDGSNLIWIYGKETDIDDLFFKHNVPEKYWNKILANVKCPECGNEYFDLGSIVGTKSDYDHGLEKLYKEAKKFHKQIKSLEEDLKKTLMLGLKNPFGRKLYKQVSEKKLLTIEVKGIFYRGRFADPKKPALLIKDMLIPDWGIPFEGRYNHLGHSHFYLSENQITSEAEVLQGGSAPIEAYIQKFDIKNTIPNILDLSHELYEISLDTPMILVALFSFIENRSGTIDKFKPAYYIPRFIADCAKAAGYNGIKYTSALNRNGFNIVLFDKWDQAIPIDDPYLVQINPAPKHVKKLKW